MDLWSSLLNEAWYLLAPHKLVMPSGFGVGLRCFHTSISSSFFCLINGHSGLVLEHEKWEAFHFSRKHEDLNPPVDLGYAPYTGNTPLIPSKVWRYLGIFFDRKLLFKEHSKRYACKALFATKAMLFLGNSAHGLKPIHKWLLYRSCIIPITLYGIHLWYFDGAHFKSTIKELTKIQRQVAIWILGVFKSTPTGAVEFLAGLIPIHLQIWKLVYHNHVCMHTLADSYITCLMVASENEAEFVSMYHLSQLCNKCKSLLVDMWSNRILVDVFVLPYNKYNVPGYCLTDTCPNHIIQAIVLIQGKTTKDRAKAREAHLMTLKQSFVQSSTSDSCIMIITNASVPLLSTGYQAVAAWHTWHSDHYFENFRSSGLATSNNAEITAIGGALKALSDIFDSISDIDEIHIYSNSTYALHHMLNLSIHSAQLYALESLGVLFPWMEENANHRIFLHHIPDCKDYVFEPHHAVHCLATSTKIEAGGAPLWTITFSIKQITDFIMSDWANQFQLLQYVGKHFMYPRCSVRRQDHTKAKCIAPSHLNGGTWLM